MHNDSSINTSPIKDEDMRLMIFSQHPVCLVRKHARIFKIKAAKFSPRSVASGIRLKYHRKILFATNDSVAILTILKEEGEKRRLVPQHPRGISTIQKTDESKTWREINWKQEDKAD